MSTYDRDRKEYFREYMRRRRAGQKKAQSRAFTISHRNRANAGKKGALSHASVAAAQFKQPSLIDLPQHLKIQFNAIMEMVRRERGAMWSAISLVH
jgi:hypothetical protein